MKPLLKKYISQDTINRLHGYEARLASLRYGYPSRKLKIIGITGTNGKTSVCHYVTQLLEASGKKVGMITTVAVSVAGKRTLNTSKMTTLKASVLQKHLAQIVAAGCEYAVVETTSHALDQNRVAGIYYDVVAITNITHDHLDYHQSMNDYQVAKEKLFAHHPQVSVVNADIPEANDFLKYEAIKKFTFGIVDQLRPKEATIQPDVTASLLKHSPAQTQFKLSTPFGEAEAVIPLPGRFTVSNVLCAITIGLSQSVSLDKIIDTLSILKPVEGRLEPVDCGQPYSIFVDFAHTPDALLQVYKTLRPMVAGKLIAVLGATGRRDKTKRPMLGALAGQYADLVIVTNEDPYDEDPVTIINEVAAGVPRGRPKATQQAVTGSGEGQWWWKMSDRREAISKALAMAEKNDLVIITGKGGEHVMAIGEKLVPYNDVQVIKELLK
jgi:UDP-N-acetylmuramoyl-L-alanyl-D-glutamate--2,6-diaminopimelate ligase